MEQKQRKEILEKIRRYTPEVVAAATSLTMIAVAVYYRRQFRGLLEEQQILTLAIPFTDEQFDVVRHAGPIVALTFKNGTKWQATPAK